MHIGQWAMDMLSSLAVDKSAVVMIVLQTISRSTGANASDPVRVFVAVEHVLFSEVELRVISKTYPHGWQISSAGMHISAGSLKEWSATTMMIWRRQPSRLTSQFIQTRSALPSRAESRRETQGRCCMRNTGMQALAPPVP